MNPFLMHLTAYILIVLGVISGSKSTLWVLTSLVLHKNSIRDWFGENHQNISQLLFTKHELYKLLLNENLSNRPVVEKAYKEHKATVQGELRKMKNEWWADISEEILCAR